MVGAKVSASFSVILPQRNKTSRTFTNSIPRVNLVHKCSYLCSDKRKQTSLWTVHQPIKMRVVRKENFSSQLLVDFMPVATSIFATVKDILLLFEAGDCIFGCTRL